MNNDEAVVALAHDNMTLKQQVNALRAALIELVRAVDAMLEPKKWRHPIEGMSGEAVAGFGYYKPIDRDDVVRARDRAWMATMETTPRELIGRECGEETR